MQQDRGCREACVAGNRHPEGVLGTPSPRRGSAPLHSLVSLRQLLSAPGSASAETPGLGDGGERRS